MTVTTTHLGLLAVLLHHLLLGEREESGIGRIGHELARLAERIDGVKGRLLIVGSGRAGNGVGRDGVAGGGGIEGVVHALELVLLLLGELIDAVGSGVVERLQGVGRMPGSGEGLTEAGVDRAHVVAGAYEIEGGTERLDGILGAPELKEALSELGKGTGGRGVGAVDGGLAICRARLGHVARGQQGATEAHVGLVGRGIGRVLRGGREALGGRGEIARGGKRLALIGQKRAALAVSGIGEGGGIAGRGVPEHAEAHQRVAVQMVDFAVYLVGGLNGREHLGCSGKIAGTVGGTRLLEKLSVQGGLPIYSYSWTISTRTISSPARSSLMTSLPSSVCPKTV